MKRLSQKKEERKRRSVIHEDAYEYSEASSNIERNDDMTAYSSPEKHENSYISAKVA